jgi:hypothetical protein
MVRLDMLSVWLAGAFARVRGRDPERRDVPGWGMPRSSSTCSRAWWSAGRFPRRCAPTSPSTRSTWGCGRSAAAATGMTTRWPKRSTRVQAELIRNPVTPPNGGWKSISDVEMGVVRPAEFEAGRLGGDARSIGLVGAWSQAPPGETHARRASWPWSAALTS